MNTSTFGMARMLCAVFLANLIAAKEVDKQYATLSKDKYGTVHLSSTNESMPFSINGINIVQAISEAIACTQKQCPPNFYRTGCHSIMFMANS
eukprot:gene4871-6891_t